MFPTMHVFFSIHIVGVCVLHVSIYMLWRILSRPQAADTYISETLDTIFWNRNSIVSRIQHSHAVGQIFNRYVKQIEDCPVRADKIRNLSARKHRIEWSEAHGAGNVFHRCIDLNR